MHTMWKGSISFGLVNIPIKMYAATEDKDVKLRYLHEKCHTPVKYEKTCPRCEEKLMTEEIVKGYEYEAGQFVIVDEEELKELEQENRKKTIDILDFVQLDEIDPIYFNRSYFIGPSENGERPYMLLQKALADTGRIGLAKITIRTKEQLAVVRVYDRGMVLETIFYPDEVRQMNHVPGLPETIDVNEKELGMAKQLIDQLTTPFEPEKYNNDYRVALLDLIQGKVTSDQGKAAKPEEPRRNVVDLMEALQASIDETKPKKKRTRKKKEAAVK